MKQKHKIILYWILIGLFSLLITNELTAQTFGYGNQTKDYVYFKATFDPNNAFGIIDNPRTVIESYGFDYDIELGARYKAVGAYIFYGSFQEINYFNYGAGVDVYFSIFENIDTSLGGNLGIIARKYGDHWGGHLAPALRAITTIWFIDNVGLTLTAQLQNRPDIDKLAIFEGNIGLIIKSNN